MSGLELIKSIHLIDSGIPLLALSMHEESSPRRVGRYAAKSGSTGVLS